MMKSLKKTGLALLASTLLMTGYAQSEVPKGWHLKDLKTDGYYGISLDKAYDFLKSKNKKKHTGDCRHSRFGYRYHA